MNMKQPMLAPTETKNRPEEDLDKFRDHLGVKATGFDGGPLMSGFVGAGAPQGSGLLVEEKDAHMLPPNMPNFDPTLE